MAIIDIKNLSFRYSGSKDYALRDISLQIERGSFVVVCGESGCGKSTLLRLIKKQLNPRGERTGEICYDGVDIKALDERVAVSDIGFVMQNPDNQIATDRVWHELAFGLESLGESTNEIRTRVAEICGYFGISEYYHKHTHELSGGQKQLLNLASIMIMQPKVLLLDEPTSLLDPIAASEFIATLKRLNLEFGTTIILVEHRLEEVFALADKAIIMDRAGILLYDTPKSIGGQLRRLDPQDKMQFGLPASVRLFKELGANDECPLSIRDGRNFLQEHFSNEIKSLEVHQFRGNELAVEISEAYFRYERNQPDVLNAMSLSVFDNEFLCIMGANGAGKTTLLNVISGVNRPYSGKARIYGKRLKDYSGASLHRHCVAYLPQNPQLVFVKNTLEDDLKEVTRLLRLTSEQARIRIDEVCSELGLTHLIKSHPYDLSGGEQQKAALAKLLLLEPRLILLDEPTKGIDAYGKITLAQIIAGQKQKGKTIVMVTHDVEFAAEYADRCAMFFDGKIASIDVPQIFFSKNNYYTTSASKVSRGYFENAVTVAQVAELCRKNHEKS